MEAHRHKSPKKKKENKFLTWLRGWPIDWVAVVAFIAVFSATLVAMMPTPEGEKSPVVEVVTGDTTIVEAEARLSKEMTPITLDEASPLYEYFMSADRVNIMLLGINEGMTDTIMVATYDMENQKVDIISIPRDTYYYRGSSYKEYAFHKINAIYHSQGVVKLAEAVSSTLYGMPIHYYAAVDYKGVVEIMDALNDGKGIKFNVPFHMKYDDTTKGYELHIDIPAGEQTIDSSNVMQLLRFRKTNPKYAAQGYKGYPGGDIQRIQLQQDFVKEVAKQALKPSNIVDVSKVILENIESDMTYSMATKVATKAMNFDFSNVTTHMLPGTDKIISELSFWVADETQVYDMLGGIFIPGYGEEEPAAEEGAEGETTAEGSAQ